MTEREKIERYVAARPEEPLAYQDALALYKAGMDRAGDNVLELYGGDGEVLRRVRADQDWHDANRAIRAKLSGAMRKMAAEGKPGLERMNELYYQSLLMDARVDFDAYCLYIERDRDPRKRFYAPRRSKLIRVVQLLQDLSDDKYDLVGVSLPPGTGKSATAIFYLTWLSGRNPDESMLTGSHSNAFVRGVYDECLRIYDANGEYRWCDVFPDVKVSSTNAKDCRIDLGKRKRFETLEFTSIGTGNAGLYRAMQLLFCDDLVSGLELALSRERLDKLWETYTTDLRQRKIGDHCKELHIATRWSTGDVVSRLERQYENDPRACFLAIPALNEKDESNFDYPYGLGYTTKALLEQREIMDECSWKALFQNQPIEREGLLYHSDELQRYFDLPDHEPDAILCVCDTKDKGTDYCSMPILYQYGDKYFVEDVVYDNSNPEIVETRLVEKCLKHKVHMGQFESNSAGGRIAQSVQERIKQQGGRTKLTTKYTTQNKETRIIVASPFVKEHFYFKDDSVVTDKEYKKFLNAVCSYSMASRNKNDDSVDSLAMCAEYVQSFSTQKVQVFARPF